ncbi:3'-5' exonuclease [Elaeis guineensis]|uniref:Werner Syndrome-like exonuclease n=1 Tax=Elaeis guineensis var. tenera TaxID=51953 RepID=A0A6I9S726_ELAGV|nr:Werner Syndrome-like exonuclease [Elaeis guineensis]
MSTSIRPVEGNRYIVTFNGTDDIMTTVTSSGDDVEAWIDEILRVHHRRLSRLIVGFDVEWRPSYSRVQNPVAVLQLCVGRRCLVFLILHADYVPDALIDFLANERYKFVGVGIDADVDRLSDYHFISVENTTDLRVLAAAIMNRPELNQKGLAGLAGDVLGVQVRKPREVTMSRWDQRYLTLDQIKYAAVDAFLSFEIGRRLVDFDF